MKETIKTVQDERIVNYSVALRNALELVRNIERKKQEGEEMVYLTIYETTKQGTTSRSSYVDIGYDLLPISQGAAFGAYRELAYDRQIDKATGEEIGVINKDGKEIADDIIEDMGKKKEGRSEAEKT